jgi:ribosomal protein S18 acetylase RimI-like enzyme
MSAKEDRLIGVRGKLELRHVLLSECAQLAEIDLEEGGFKSKADQFVESDKRKVMVARVGDVIVGYMIFERLPRELYLNQLFVRPAHRGNKYSRDMVAWLIQQLPAYNRSRLTLVVWNSNNYAKSCYFDLGFTVDGTIPPGRPYRGSGSHALSMRYIPPSAADTSESDLDN